VINSLERDLDLWAPVKAVVESAVSE
jgi:hypothetical protein